MITISEEKSRIGEGRVIVARSVFAIALLMFSTPVISGDEYVLRVNYESLIGSEIHQEAYQGLSNVSQEARYGSDVFQGRTSVDCKVETVVTYQRKDQYEQVIVNDYCDWQYYGEPENTSYRDTSELQGTTVVVEKIGGVWKHRLSKGTPSDEQKRLLTLRESRYDTNDLYPDRPVKVGDVWEIPSAALGLLLGSTLINTKGEGTGRLEELVDYGGTPSALIVIEGRVSGEQPFVGDKHTTKLEGTIVAMEYRSLKDKHTLYAKAQGEILLTQEETVGDQKGKLTVTGPFIGVLTQRIR